VIKRCTFVEVKGKCWGLMKLRHIVGAIPAENIVLLGSVSQPCPTDPYFEAWHGRIRPTVSETHVQASREIAVRAGHRPPDPKSVECQICEAQPQLPGRIMHGIHAVFRFALFSAIGII